MAVDTTEGIIEVRAPQYFTDPRLSDLITLATGRTGDEFGDCKELAIALLVMHWLAREELRGGDGGSSTSGSGVAGAVTSESEGQLSRSYGVAADSQSKDGDLSTTAWGLELLQLRNDCLFLPRSRMFP